MHTNVIAIAIVAMIACRPSKRRGGTFGSMVC